VILLVWNNFLKVHYREAVVSIMKQPPLFSFKYDNLSIVICHYMQVQNIAFRYSKKHLFARQKMHVADACRRNMSMNSPSDRYIIA